jgi:hypothetical protein
MNDRVAQSFPKRQRSEIRWSIGDNNNDKPPCAGVLATITARQVNRTESFHH